MLMNFDVIFATPLHYWNLVHKILLVVNNSYLGLVPIACQVGFDVVLKNKQHNEPLSAQIFTKPNPPKDGNVKVYFLCVSL
jgi:hypothetical protein